MHTLSTLKRLCTEHFSSGMWLTGKNFLVSALSLIITYIGANYLTPETFGSYKYLIGFFTFVSIFTLTGAPSALTRHIAKTGYTPLRYIMKKTAGVSLFAAGFLLAVAGYYFHKENHTFAIVFGLVALLLPLLQSQHLYMAYLNGTKKYQEWFFCAVSAQLVISAGVSTAMLTNGNLLSAAVAFFLSQALAFTFVSAYVFWKYQLFKETSPTPEVYSFAKKLSLVNISKKVVAQLDIILAFQFIGPAATAAYSISKTPVQLIHGQGGVVRTLALPQFSKHNPEAVKKTLHQKALLFSLLMSVIAVGYIIVAPVLFTTLFPLYTDAVVYTQIMALSLPAVPHVLYLEALTAKQSVRSLFVAETIAPVITVVLMLILTIMYGLVGLVSSYVIGQWLRGFFAIFRYYRNG